MSFKYNPDHAVGTCENCGEEMVWNVPRLGPDGGFVHKSTQRFECTRQSDFGLNTAVLSPSGFSTGDVKMSVTNVGKEFTLPCSPAAFETSTPHPDTTSAPCPHLETDNGVCLKCGHSLYANSDYEFPPTPPVVQLVEKLTNSAEELKKLCLELYLAGTWTCSELSPDRQKELWTRLRDQLGLEPGTATKHGVGAASCICSAFYTCRTCPVHGWQIRCRE